MSAKAFLVNPRVSVISGTECIRGIATTEYHVYIVRYGSNHIEVYDKDNIAVRRQNIDVPEMSDAYSMTACQHYNCLYISDSSAQIHRLQLSNRSVTKWSLKDISWGLSVTSNHNLLVSLYNTKIIQEYTTQGSLVREINPGISTHGLIHSIEMSTGQIVVCHWRRPQLRVLTVDTSGKVITSYDGPSGSAAGQLVDPHCLTLDSQNNVLVADYNHSKVVLFSPTLNHLGDITLSQHQLSRPYRLQFDQLRGRLYIGEESGLVFVLERASESKWWKYIPWISTRRKSD